MLWVYGHYKYFLFLQCGDRLYASESDVYRRQILTTKGDPRAERVKAACLESRSSRARPRVWHSSFKVTNNFFPAHS